MFSYVALVHKKKKTIFICWHFVAFVLLAKFNTDEFWHTIKPAHVPDQLFGGGTSSWQSVIWCVPDGRVTGCSWADLVNGSWERGLVSLLIHPLLYAWSCSAERYLRFCLDCHAPGSSGHTWVSSAASCGCTMIAPSPVRLALIYLLIWSLWEYIYFKWFPKLWPVGRLQQSLEKNPFPLSLVEFFMF